MIQNTSQYHLNPSAPFEPIHPASKGQNFCHDDRDHPAQARSCNCNSQNEALRIIEIPIAHRSVFRDKAESRNHLMQASFDELIANSLAALDQACTKDVNQEGHCTHRFHRNFCGGNSFLARAGTNDSIDDFLEDYRHELNSICEFMSVADETQNILSHPSCEQTGYCTPLVPPLDVSQLNSSDWRPGGVVSYQALSTIQAHKDPRNVCLNSLKSTSAQPILDKKGENRSIEKPQSSGRARRLRLSAEKREERRRIQNREAQRRYREKSMTLRRESFSEGFPFSRVFPNS